MPCVSPWLITLFSQSSRRRGNTKKSSVISFINKITLYLIIAENQKHTIQHQLCYQLLVGIPGVI